MTKRIIALLLVCLMAVQFAACSETTSDDGATGGTGNSASDNTGEADAGATDEDELAKLYEDVPTGDYGGHEFVMLNNESNFAYTMMTAEDLNGEGINDAIYNRNSKVSDDLNIVIKESMVAYNQVTSDMNAAITAGDETYACFWNESQFVAPFAIQGNLLNINDIDAINLEKPWWNSEALSDIEIGPYQYFLVGDLHLMFKESFWMVGFNKNIIDENALTDPYEVVREGAWTYDQMKSYMEAVARDLDGNGVIDGNDRFGVTCYSGCIMPLIIGGDEVLIEKDADGVPQFVSPGDRFYSVYEKIVNTIFTANDYVFMDGKVQNVAQYADGWHGVFSSGHALFYLEPIGSLKKLRDMDAEFGIIPFPKYDEAQQDYVTYIAKYAALCGIPISSKDPQRTGVILENLCAVSFGELREAYAETTLNFKYIRDTESAEMLNLILNSGRFNLTDILGVSTPTSTLETSASSGTLAISSQFAKIMNASNKALEKNVKSLMKIE